MSVFRNFAPTVALAIALIAGRPARADVVYLSLGDSLAFGYDVSSPASSRSPSLGDQGFVRPFADFLAGGNGGVRPDVLNLGIVGEQSTSFFNAADLSPSGPPRVWQLNSNYANATISQEGLMLSSIASLHAAGDVVGAVSLVFGANDIFALAGSAAFAAATSAGQQALVVQTITAVLGRYAQVLQQLQALAPEAKIYLPGYYNPFPAALAPAERGFYDLVLGAFNPGVRALASNFGATYVDLYSPFVGRELQLTNIGISDVHPNRMGYDAIATAFIAASVPEPASVASLAVGLAGAAVLAWKRRAAA